MWDFTWFTSFFTPEVSSFLLASLPLTESRLAIPLALGVFHLSPLATFVSTFLGNILPVPFLLLFLPRLIDWVARRHEWSRKFLIEYFASLREKHHESYVKWGALFLFLFVLLPGPGTGVWTAGVIAGLFRIDRRFAFLSIVVGQLIGSLLLIAVSLGVFQGIEWLQV